MKSLEEYRKESKIKKYTKNLRLTWYFDKAWEKFVLILLSFLGLIKLVELLIIFFSNI